MRREKFISGGLEGAGVEGKAKRKPSSGERREDEENNPMETGFGNSDKPLVKKSSGSKIKSEDPFYTGFGEAKQEKKGHYAERSAKEKEADIFSDGFGSKEISRERSVGESRISGGSEEEAGGKMKDFSDDQRIVAPSEPKKKSKSPEDDPFYTGFGYTNQRDDDNIRHSENKPLRREDLLESSGQKEMKEEVNFVTEIDEIFENRNAGKETEEEGEDYIAEAEESEPEKPVKRSSVFDKGDIEKSEPEKPVKRSSVFDKSDIKESEPEKPVKRSSVFDKGDIEESEPEKPVKRSSVFDKGDVEESEPEKPVKRPSIFDKSDDDLFDI